MAVPSELLYHPDTTEKHPITKNELAFLQDLQDELNTQDGACTRDPRYWGLMRRIELPSSPENCDVWQLIFDGTVIADNIDAAMKYLTECIPNTLAKLDLPEEPGCIEMTDLEYILDNRDSSEEMLELQVIPVQYHHEIVPNAVFLTHKDAVQHLKQNRHNYDANVYPYCMCADRSPTFESLIKILRQTDWSTLAANL